MAARLKLCLIEIQDVRASQQVSSTATPVYNASPLDSTLPDPSSGSSVSTSRYGRPIKFPSKYSDFVV